MNSWIFILSQFTAEALLYEATALFFLLALYAGFWIIRKRRYGVIDNELPSGPVKAYLNELIINAEELRTQLFGLLGAAQAHTVARNWLSSDGPALHAPEAKIGAPAPSSGGAGGDPELSRKVQALESKLNDQTRSVEQLSIDKGRLERELAEAKARPAADSGGGGGGDSAKLQQKVQELETKLAEYNVIEDDLANLKRLQQENAQLKAQLANAGAAPAAAAPAPAAPEPTPAPAAAAPAAPAPEAAPVEDPLAGLAAQTEQSLAAPAAAAAAPAPAAGDAAPPADTGGGGGGAVASPEKTDADLVAEFEKMLKG